MKLKKITRLSMFLGLSIVLSILESFIPISNIPGIKLGLANVIVLAALYMYGFKDTLYLTILRVVLIGILRTGLFSITFWFSLSGAVLSVIMMSLFKRFTKLSIVGISIIGSISHIIGQILVATLFMNLNILYYLPIIILIAIPTGLIIGLISKETIKIIDNN